MATKIKLRRDSATNWTTANPVMAIGEPGLETNTLKLKFGDGVSAWNTLPYATNGIAGGISLASLSAVNSGTPAGSGSLAYNSSTGAFTYTPPNLSTYLTSISGAQVTTALGYTPLGAGSLTVVNNASSPFFSTLSYNNGVFTFTPFVLPVASTSVSGGVKVDGTSITINNGIITAVGGGGGGGGGGTVNPGLGTALAYYPSSAAVVDDIVGVYWNSVSSTLSVTGTVTASNLVGALAYQQIADGLGFNPISTASITLSGASSNSYSSLSYNQSNGAFVYTAFSLAVAGSAQLGGVKIDTAVAPGLALNGNNVLVLNAATSGALGGIRVGTGLSIDGNGILSSSVSAYTLPNASGSVLGGVKVGTGLSIDGGGILSSTITQFTLPTASTSVLGGVKIDGSTITISAGVISAVPGIAAAGSLTGTTLASGVVNSSLQTLGSVQALNMSGSIISKQISRTLQLLTNATGTVAHDWTAGDRFYHSSINTDFTINVTNLPTTVGKVYELTLLLDQGATTGVPTAVQIAGSVQTVNWNGGTAVTGFSNQLQEVVYRIHRVASGAGGWRTVAYFRNYA
jgi:hypothetical protein